MQKKLPTMPDVARAAQVSVATVSRVLNQNPRVAPELRTKVNEAMSKLGYRPNAVAQSMRTRETRVVACIVSNVSNPMTAGMVSAAEEVMRDAGYAMVMANSGDNAAIELELFDFFLRRRVDGILASLGREDDPAAIACLRDSNIPVVLLERQIGAQFDAVLSDQGAGCYMATRHLLGIGHRDIGLITGPETSRPVRERIKQMQRAYAELKLKPKKDLIKTGYNQSIEFGSREARGLLTGQVIPSAIIAGAYEMTGVIKVLREMNMSVPRDISLISLGDPEFLSLVNPSITAIRWDEKQVGRMGAQILLQRIERKNDPSLQQARYMLAPTELVHRESCAPAPSSAISKAAS